MRRCWRGKGWRREKVRVGMEADIYPRQCVTGSAKSAMMNVLAGINPQCTPPPPSSCTASPFCNHSRPPRTPLRHLSHPLTARSHTLSKCTSLLRDFNFTIFFLLYSLLAFPSFSVPDVSAHCCTTAACVTISYGNFLIKLRESSFLIMFFILFYV